MAHRRSARAAVGLLMTGACLALTGCNGIPPEPFVVARAASSTPQPPAPVTAEALRPAFDAFAGQHPGGLALAWAPVGEPERVQMLGQTRDLDAWSTIKVPIAVAAAANASNERAMIRVETHTRAAIRRSDNQAATALWRSLGAASAAQDKTEAVLRAGGDERTQAAEDATGRQRGFGRTVWLLEDSARFASMLPCLPDTEFVLADMEKIDPDQQWGIGALEASTRFKGGWGPSDHGYLARQLGIVDSASGQVAVAVAVQPEDGGHATAAATASASVTWLVGRLGPADSGVCAAAAPTAG